MRHKIYTRDEPVHVLAIGGVPGKADEPTARTELGARDPAAVDQGALTGVLALGYGRCR